MAGLGDGWPTGLLVGTCEASGLEVAGRCARVPVFGLGLAQPAATSNTIVPVAAMSLRRLPLTLCLTVPSWRYG